MSVIDEKLVRIKLDNSDLKKKITESEGFLDKFKAFFKDIGEKFNTTSISNGLKKVTDEISKISAKKSTKQIQTDIDSVNFNKLNEAIGKINSRFSLMGEVGTAAIHKITNSVMNSAKGLYNSLGPGSFVDGFREYETNMRAINMIMANAPGATIDIVNQKLDELNDYSDKTIYKFGDMTTAIGRFTAAGVDLDSSVAAIKGLGNLAATAGASSTDLARSYTQIAQGLSSGQFRVIDWNSMNAANLNTRKLRDELQKTAVQVGTLKEVMNDGEFRGSLERGWLTSEVFVKTMQRFAEDESMLKAAQQVRTFTQLMDTMRESIGSGWSKSFRLLIGDFEQASELFTRINDMFTKFVDGGADKRNALITEFNKLGGRDVLVRTLFQSFENLGRVLQVVGSAWRSVFPEMTAERLLNMAKSVESFVKSLQMSEETGGKVKYILTGLFRVVETVVEIFKELAKAVFNAIPPAFIVGLLDILVLISDLGSAFRDSVLKGRGFIDFIRTVSNVIRYILTVVGVGIQMLVKQLRSMKWDWQSILKYIVTGIYGLYKIVSMVFSGIGNLITGALKRIGIDIKPVLDGANKLIVSMYDGIKKLFSGFGKGIDFGGMFKGIQNGASAGGSKLLGFLSTAVSTLGKVVGSVGQGIISFFSVLWSFASKLGEIGIAGITRLGDGLKKLSDVVKKLFDNISAGHVVSAALFGGLIFIGKKLKDSIEKFKVAEVNIFNLKDAFSKFTDAIKPKKFMSVAIAISALVLSLGLLASMDIQSIMIGMSSMAIGIGLFIHAMKQMNGLDVKPKSLITMAITIRLISGAVKSLSNMSLGGAIAAAGSLSVLLLVMSRALKNLNDISFSDPSKQLLSMGLTIRILASSLKVLATIPFGNLLVATASLSTLMLSLTLAMKHMSSISADRKGVGMAGIAASLIAMGVAINFLLPPLLVFSFVPFDNLVRGLLLMGSAMLVMAGSVRLMGSSTASLLGVAATLLTFAAAIGVFTIAVTALGLIPWQVTAIGIGLLVAGFAAFGVILGLIGTVFAPGLDAFSGLITAIGTASTTAGLGVLAFGAGINLVSLAIVNFVSALPGAAQNMAAFWDAVTQSSQNMSMALKTILVSLVQALVQAVVEGLEAIVLGIVKLCQVIAAAAEPLAVAAMTLIEGLIRGIADKLPDIIDAAITLAIKFINGLAEGITNNSGSFLDAIYNMLDSVQVMVLEFIHDLASALPDFLGGGVVDSVDKMLGKTKDRIKSRTKEINEALEETGETSKKVKEDTTDIFGGVKASAEEAVPSIEDLKNKILGDGGIGGMDMKGMMDKVMGGGLESLQNGGANMLTNTDDLMAKLTNSVTTGGGGLLEGAKNVFNKLGETFKSFNFQELFNSMDVANIDEFTNKLKNLDFGGFFEGIKQQVGDSGLKELLSQYGLESVEAFNNQTTFDKFKFAEEMIESVQAAEPEVTQQASQLGTNTGNAVLDAWKDGITQEEFEALGEMWGFNFSHGIWQGDHITDAGVEMVRKFEESIPPDKLAAIGEALGIDLSGGLTHEGGKYVTEAGAELIRRLTDGTLSNEQLLEVARLLGYSVGENVEAGGKDRSAQAGTTLAQTAAEHYALENPGATISDNLDKNIDTQAGVESSKQAGVNNAQAVEEGAKSVSLTSLSQHILGALTDLFAAAQAYMQAVAAGAALGNGIVDGIKQTDFTEPATTLVTNFTTAFISKKAEGQRVASDLSKAMVTAIKDIDYKPAGIQNATEYIDGVRSREGSARSVGTSLANQSKSGAMNVNMRAPGTKNGNEYVQGVASSSSAAYSAGRSVANSARSGAGSTNAYHEGVHMMQGFVNGMHAMSGSVYATANNIANSARSAIRSALRIHSPSRALYEDGGWFGQGFANGISSKFNLVKQRAMELGNGAREFLKEATEQAIAKSQSKDIYSPIIRPEFDGSNIPATLLDGRSTIGLGMNRLQSSVGVVKGLINPGNTTSNNSSVSISNEGLFKGATFTVREEADIPKIAKYVDAVLKSQSEMNKIFNIGKG